MNSAATQVRIGWRPPVLSAVISFVVAAGIWAFCDPLVMFFYTFVLVPTVSLLLLILAGASKGRSQRLSKVWVMLSYVVVTAVMFRYAGGIDGIDGLRPTVRWLFLSRQYKSEVLAQNTPANGELKHVEWDGWGFPGAGDTVEYLVFDPNDLLLATERRSSGRFDGIPCEVPFVRRLETHWYSVRFYTDTEWGRCQ